MRAAELCSDCGICCDGTLFSSVSIEGAGLATARQHRLPIVETAEEHKLALPCGALRGVLCGIYEERPECCAEFSCELLLDVEHESRSFRDARRIIDATRAVSARVSAEVGDTPWWVAHRAAIAAERGDATWARDNAALLSDLKQLHELVTRHFWG